MKIALIMGNHKKQGYPPLGVLYLAGYIRKYIKDSIIHVYDVFPDIEEVLNEDYNIIGLSCMTIQYPDVDEFARMLREQYTGIIIVGGVHITLTRQLPEWADYGIVGEGEETIRELIEFIADRKAGEEINAVSGVLYFHNNKTFYTGDRPLIKQLDDIPFPAWDLIDMHPYLQPNNVFGTVIGRGTSLMTSRGCIYHCEYCAASKMWKTVRFHSARYVVDMIEYVVREYGIDYIWFADDHFALKKSRLSEIADLIEQRNINVGVGISCRIEAYDQEMADLLKRIGVMALGLGLETGSDRMLKKIKNGCQLTVNGESDVIHQMVRDGFQVHGMFMINMPDETVKDLFCTIRFIKSLPLSKVSVAVAMPYYGTSWWDIAVNQGLIPDVIDVGFWRACNMKKLEDDRPIFKTKISHELLKSIYDDLIAYGKSLFYFDWENR